MLVPRRDAFRDTAFLGRRCGKAASGLDYVFKPLCGIWGESALLRGMLEAVMPTKGRWSDETGGRLGAAEIEHACFVQYPRTIFWNCKK